MKRKLLVLFTAILFSLTLFSVTVSADIGPKPSVSISFLNMGSEECYCTLLSEHKSTGPHSVSSKKVMMKYTELSRNIRIRTDFIFWNMYSL